MRYFALAMDYDGTLAHHGVVDSVTIDALVRARASGRKLILVTGRQLIDLKATFPRLDLFDRVVLENGAVLYRPQTQEEKSLAVAPPPSFARELAARGVDPVSTGRVIVATWHPHEITVLEVIRDTGLELQVIFNKGAVMVLPTGINKETGLEAALRELGLSRHNTVGVGDAENDHAFLTKCEGAVAVANALPVVKEEVDWVTPHAQGAGVVDLVDALLRDDLPEGLADVRRHDLLIGTRMDGSPLLLRPFGTSVLVAGASGSGKTRATVAILEKLADADYQYCLIDPEGDHEHVEGAVEIDSCDRPTRTQEVVGVLSGGDNDAVVNLLELPLEERPTYFTALIVELQHMRARTGRPHWIAVDEAHHMLPPEWQAAPTGLPATLTEMLLVTVHPDRVALSILRRMDMIIAIGAAGYETLRDYAHAVQIEAPSPPPRAPFSDEALVWRPAGGSCAEIVRLVRGRRDHLRHRRKYAEGDLSPDLSFYFRGPRGKLNLRAQNLMTFNQLAEGVDDATWLFHLRAHDYSRWFRDTIKDPTLADAAERAESTRGLSPSVSRTIIRGAIQQRYTRSA